MGLRKRLFQNRGVCVRLLLLRNKGGGGDLIVTKCYEGWGEGGKKCLILALHNI